MTVADITISILRARLVALRARVAFLAHTLGLLRLRVHEAGTLSSADTALLGDRANNTTVLPEETLLALALRGALAALFHANTPLDSTTDTTNSIPSAFHCTVTALEACPAQALATTGTSWHTSSLAGTDATLGVFRAGGLALSTKVPLLALAEGHLLHLVVEA